MAGDGGISMLFGDLMTVVAQELPIKIASTTTASLAL